MSSKLINFICCCIQIDAGHVVHLRETWLTITFYTWMVNLYKEIGKSMNRAYQLCVCSKVKILSCMGKTCEQLFIFGTQDSDGGQSDLYIIKVLLDLLCILCVTDRGGGKRRKMLQMMRYTRVKKKKFNIFNAYQVILGLKAGMLTSDTFSSSSRFMISNKWSVVHSGWFSSQLLETIV